MARKLYYMVFDNGTNVISDAAWEDIIRLQHWYNSEFRWTAGRLTFKMFAVFPNPEARADEATVWSIVARRKKALRERGILENEIIRILEEEGLALVKAGGYFDGCLASGFTRVASNEWNALLVSEFLLKASTIAPRATIEVFDEGVFIKPRRVRIREGNVIILREHRDSEAIYQSYAVRKKAFSVVNAAKYDDHPVYSTVIDDFGSMDGSERTTLLHDYSWLGFDGNYDVNGDDIEGVNLNLKVRKFLLEDL